MRVLVTGANEFIGAHFVDSACSLAVIMLQRRMRDLAAAAVRESRPLPREYHRGARWWFALGWPAIQAVLAAFWLMTAKPDLW
jgi:uncharacterized membrane protein